VPGGIANPTLQDFVRPYRSLILPRYPLRRTAEDEDIDWRKMRTIEAMRVKRPFGNPLRFCADLIAALAAGMMILSVKPDCKDQDTGHECFGYCSRGRCFVRR